MSFSNLRIFALGDPKGEQSWAVAHYYEHLAFNAAVDTITTAINAVGNYPLQKLEKNQFWLNAHQRWHQAIWSAIGAGISSDLATLDWNKQNQVDDWLQLHASIHDDIRGVLGL